MKEARGVFTTGSQILASEDAMPSVDEYFYETGQVIGDGSRKRYATGRADADCEGIPVTMTERKKR